jgi:hypothetical protein
VPSNSGPRAITLQDLQTSPNKLNEELQYLHDILSTTHAKANTALQNVTKLSVAFQTSQAPPLSGTGSVGGPGANVTIVSANWINLADDGSGQPKVQINVVYLLPSPAVDFQGVEVYLDHPDSSGIALLIADGTKAADGTNAVSNGDAFSPDDIGFYAYDPKNTLATNQIQFSVPAPKQDERWRVYLVTSTSTQKGTPIKKGLPNESPSYQITVTSIFNGGGPNSASGREYAPLVLNPALSTPPATWLDNNSNPVNPYIEVVDSGDQFFRFQAQFDWPTGDQNFSTLGGVDLELSDGFVTELVSSPSPSSGQTTYTYTSDRIPVKGGTVTYNLYIISYDVNGNRNSVVFGVTPKVTFNITRQNGPAGQEYAKNVIPAPIDVNANTPGDFLYLLAVGAADGTVSFRVIMNWTKPVDPQWAAAELVVKKPDGNFYSVGKTTLPPSENYVAIPAAPEVWTFYVRSQDINGKVNTITGGTPQQTISVGTSGGLFNLAKASSANFSSEFQVVGNVFQVKNLKADSIVTGTLQVGGGGGKVSQFKIFDSVGSIIGMIGDDTLGTGFVGGWLKKAAIGGTNPLNAPIQADTTGKVTISGATLVVTAGNSTINIDASNYIKISDVTNGYFSQLNNVGLFVALAGDSSSVTSSGFNTTRGYFVGGVQVVGSRKNDPGVPTFANFVDVQGWCTNLRSALHAHGLF